MRIITAGGDYLDIDAYAGIIDGKSYFVTDTSEVKTWLEHLLGVRFNGHIAVANRTWLRKEILRADQDHDLQKAA